MAKQMIIDGIPVEFTDEKNILTLVRKAGIDLPTFCYYSDLSIYGACRMCVVEDQWGGIIASCSTPPKDHMIVKTNTPKLHQHRKMILELLLAAHCRDCTVCEQNGHCRLQELANRFGLKEVRFPNNPVHTVKDLSSKSIVRDPSKCIHCGDCVRMCNEVQNVGAIDFAYRGSNLYISTAFNRDIADTNCVNCGQCAAVCPTGAITVKRDTKEVWKALYDPSKRVIAQIAPAVRVALGEEFGLEPGVDSIGKANAALRKLGFDEVFDTSVGADLTIMEEAKELVERLENKGVTPMFTSCCPAWIRYVETRHPELLPNISSCKSPMEMFGPVLKEFFKEADAKEERETISVAIMPCSAKKFEASREEFRRNGIPDVDYVITTYELITMIKEIGIQFDHLEPESSDAPFSLYSGAGVIFGASGGVMEAAIRRVVEDKTPGALREISYLGLRGLDGVKCCTLPYGDRTLRIAAVSGLANAESLIQKIQSGEEEFDFVEVMACPGGCIAGAGQPFSRLEERKKRADGIYRSDKTAQIKRSEENPVMEKLYSGLLKGREHELLHVNYKK